MKLIEALKNLKTVQKRIEKNCLQISEYAAYVSTDQPTFESADVQRKEVEALVQSNLDLIKEYLKLKTAIEFTNLNTNVAIGWRTHSISELITIRRTSGAFYPATFNALNSKIAMQKLNQFIQKQGGINPLEPAKVIPLYNEAWKNEHLRNWEEFFSAIDGRLEVVNAETELLNY